MAEGGGQQGEERDIEMPTETAGRGADIEMPTETAVDPWAGAAPNAEDLETPTAPADFHRYGEAEDLKAVPQLDTYNELGNQYNDLHESTFKTPGGHATSINDLVEEERHSKQAEALEDAAEDIGEASVNSFKSIPFVGESVADALEDAGDRLEDAVDSVDGPVFGPGEHFSTAGQAAQPNPILPDGTPYYTDPSGNTYELKSMEGLDTYEELEEEYQSDLGLRDRLLDEQYKRDQGEALEDAAEDVGEAVLDSYKSIPFVGEGVADGLEDLGDRLEDTVDAMPPADNPNPWAGAAPAGQYQGPTEPLDRGNADVNAEGLEVDKPFVDLHDNTIGFVNPSTVGTPWQDSYGVPEEDDPVVEDVVEDVVDDIY